MFSTLIYFGFLGLMVLGPLNVEVLAIERTGAVTKLQRERMLADPVINLGSAIPTPESLFSGRSHGDGCGKEGIVHCVASPASLGGTNPKFNCFLASPDNRTYFRGDGTLRIEKIDGRSVVRGDFFDGTGRLQSDVYLDRERGKFLDRSGRPRDDISPRPIKVKYNDKNWLQYDPHWSVETLRVQVQKHLAPPFRKARDPYTEVAATRLFWALGYPVDRSEATDAVICYGCNGTNLIAIDAMIDSYYPGIRVFAEGSDVEQGWSTKEVKSGHYASWSREQQMYFDGLVILGTLIHHKSNERQQNNLLCETWEQGQCQVRATMLIHDLGSVFGASNAKGRLEAWKSTGVWARPDDPSDCAVALDWKDGGGHLEVGDDGRRFVIDKFSELTDDHLLALFKGAKFQRVDGQLRLRTYQKLFPEASWIQEIHSVEPYLDEVFTSDSGDAMLSKIFEVLSVLEARLDHVQREQLDHAVVQTWVALLRSKVAELANKRCPT